MLQSQVTAQPKEKRIRNFSEVSIGYNKKLALEEARRCPQCLDPKCVKGCPLGINIPGFIRALREGNVSRAYEIITEENCLPSICGRICSAPCEKACILNEEKAPIAIRHLERYTADFGKSKYFKKEQKLCMGKKVAVVGAGPSGLTAAFELAKNDYQVTIFEAFDKAGGVLRYGIPEFRIPKKILNFDINEIISLGVDIVTSFYVGRTSTIDEIFKEGFDVILLSTGAGIPKFKELPGANLKGVYYGEEFLMRVNNIKQNIFSKYKAEFFLGEKVVVIGLGNTALDCARAAVRLGRDVTIIFKRTEEEMRVKELDKEYAKQEGVKFQSLVKSDEILSDQNNCVGGLRCLRMDYADVNSDNNWELIPVPDSEFILDCDTVIIAIGHRPNTTMGIHVDNEKIIKLNNDGTIKVNNDNKTSVESIFAAGNVVSNAGPLIQAMTSGKKAAKSVDNCLK